MANISSLARLLLSLSQWHDYCGESVYGMRFAELSIRVLAIDWNERLGEIKSVLNGAVSDESIRAL